MAFTGQLGKHASQLGNLQLGAIGNDEFVTPNDVLVVAEALVDLQTQNLEVSESHALVDSVDTLQSGPPVIAAETLRQNVSVLPVGVLRVQKDVSYGQGPEGLTPWGGTSSESSPPILASSTPADGASGQVVTVPLVFQVTSGVDLNGDTLSVSINGVQAIVGGSFLSGYSGQIFVNAGVADVIIDQHPLLPGGVSSTVNIQIRNLANELGNLNFSFFVSPASVIVAEAHTFVENLQEVQESAFLETLTLSENVVIADGKEVVVLETISSAESLSFSTNVAVDASETVTLFESVRAASFLARSVNSTTFEVQFPVELRLDNTGYLRNYTFEPVSDGAIPVEVQSVTPTFGPVGFGNQGEVIPAYKVASQAGITGTTLTDFSVDFRGTGVGAGDTISFDPSPADVKVVSVIDEHHLQLDTNFGSPVTVYYRVNQSQSATTYLFRNPSVGGSAPPFNDQNLFNTFSIASHGAVISAPMSSNASSIFISTPSGFPATPFLAQVEEEIILVQYVGYSVSVVRAQQGTTAVEHDRGALLVPLAQVQGNRDDGLQVLEVVNPYVVRVDRALTLADPLNGNLTWSHRTGVLAVTFKVTEPTNGKVYRFSTERLRVRTTGLPFVATTMFTAVSSQPQLSTVTYNADGMLVLTFTEAMRFDGALANPSEYAITGPTTVRVAEVIPLSTKEVALRTVGMAGGGYTVTVNATGTPKDVAGNPINASFNTAIFTGSVPLLARSVFTDKGPISKPVEVLQSGTGVNIHKYTSPIFGGSMQFTSNEVTLTGGAFTSNHVGLTIELTGSERNNGSYKIKSIVGASPSTRVALQASFSLPDANNNTGAVAWRLLNPHHGEIADDPSDVTVLVNGSPVTPEAVIGLLGQVVLATPPGPNDTVKVNYSWIREPTVEFRRLNSKEFLLNNWTHDTGTRGYERHHYRYRTVTTRPGSYVPENILAKQDAPLLREVSYRGYERAYSALLNDPALLLLNVPSHRIAYPPLQRSISETSVLYAANTLPENDLVSPWTRKGSGPASVMSGVLTIEDNTSGPFPGGQPLFWSRPVDLTFDHVFAATWRMKISTISAKEGCFTGVAMGWSNDKKAIVLGYLEEGGVRKIGLLKKDGGLDPSILSSWAGGLDNTNSSTDLPVDFDWSILHSYRFFQGKDGVVKVFVDGETTESLRFTEDELPFLEELNAPFDNLQGVFFGSISRPAKTVSEWDFVRYVVLPANPEQSQPAIFVSYEGSTLPEVTTPNPWTPVGYHGTETIVGDSLVLESTSVTDPSIEDSVGLVGGDFKGFTRAEPLLSASSKVDVDVDLRIDAHTHGMNPNAVMVAVDDGTRLVQLSFIASKGQSALSYPGRSLPAEAAPVPWVKVGSGGEEIVGRTLRVTDNDSAGGLLYYQEDTAPVDSDARVFSSLTDYTFEFRTKVRSYRSDTFGFSGVTADVSDGLRSVGVRFMRVLGATLATGTGTISGLTLTDLSKNFTALGVLPGDEVVVSGNNYPVASVSGTVLTMAEAIPFPGSVSYTVQDSDRKLGFHSDGTTVGTDVAFDWYGTEHTVRVVKTSTAGTLITSGFLGTMLDNGGGSSNFTDSSNGSLLAQTQIGDTIVVATGPAAGAYEVTGVTGSAVVLAGTVVSSANVIYRVERGRNMTVSLFADETLLGTVDYTDFLPSLVTQATTSFGSASAPSVQAAALSIVDWSFFNVWRMGPSAKYAGLWKGSDSTSLSGYHLPLKIQGVGSIPSASILNDPTADFTTANVQVGDRCVIDVGPNKGDYEITSVVDPQTLSVTPVFPVFPTLLTYRIPKQVDWTTDHKYRILRDPTGSVSLFIDAEATPSVRAPYDQLSFPASSVGVPSKVQGGLPSVTWGAFDPATLTRSSWDYLRYGVVRTLNEDRRVPQHQVLNQRNVMSSPEHLTGSIPHDHTQFSASSTGVPYPWHDYVENLGVHAFTKLNEGTPIVPKTQTYEVRNPMPVFTPVAALNNPQNVLNSAGTFLLNDGTTKVELLVPDDVLYRSLEVVERTAGEVSLLKPIVDLGLVSLGTLSYQNNVCLHYDGDVLPENDTTASTPWTLAVEPGASYTASPVTGILNLSASNGQILYRNDTPLPDPVGLDTTVTFILKVVEDATTGTGDSGIRVGFSAMGITAALSFVTTPLGDREVRLLDLNANETLGAIPFDFLDGAYHTYRLLKNVLEGTVEFSIDS